MKPFSTIRLSSGYGMPIIGLGVYQNYHTQQSCLDAFNAGYRHIDTAQSYKSEGHVGAAISDSGLKREDIFITTKCVSKTHGYESTKKGVDLSLERFGVNLFLIHDPFSGRDRRLQTYKALLEAKQEGKIRDVGVSNYGTHHMEEIRLEGYEMPSVNQIELHPFSHQHDIVNYCRTHSIVAQAYSPLRRGIGLDHPTITAIAKKYNKDAAQVLIRWSLQKGFAPLPKSERPERIATNFMVFDFELSETDMQCLDKLDQGKRGLVTWCASAIETP